MFFSHVRAAAGPPIQQTNCHPFRFENWLFMHNGALAGFGSVKRDLAFAVDPSLYPHIKGTTDSEVLFHLALTLGLREDPVAAMAKAIQLVESAGHEHGLDFPMQGTVAVSDGMTVWAFRYSSQQQTRTLCSAAHGAAKTAGGGQRLAGDEVAVVTHPLHLSASAVPQGECAVLRAGRRDCRPAPRHGRPPG